MSEDGQGHQTSQHGQNMLTSQAQGCVGMGSVTLNTRDSAAAKYRSVPAREDTGVCVGPGQGKGPSSPQGKQATLHPGPLTSLRLGGVHPPSPTCSTAAHPEPLEGRRGLPGVRRPGRRGTSHLSTWGRTLPIYRVSPLHQLDSAQQLRTGFEAAEGHLRAVPWRREGSSPRPWLAAG